MKKQKTKKRKINLLKVSGLITSILAIYIIYKNISYNINIACLACIFINYLYIMTPIKRKAKRGLKNAK